MLRNKIMTCGVALRLYNSDREVVSNTLRYFGYKDSMSFKAIESALLREKSTLNKLDAESKKQSKKEDVNFWRLLAQVENALGRQIDVEKVTLAYWIELLGSIREKNKPNGSRRRNRKI